MTFYVIHYYKNLFFLAVIPYMSTVLWKKLFCIIVTTDNWVLGKLKNETLLPRKSDFILKVNDSK